MQPPWLAEVPFTLPFELFAHTGKLWIQHDGASQDEFLVKGINWAGVHILTLGAIAGRAARSPPTT